MLQSLLPKLIILFIGIMPFLVPIRADLGWFNIEPQHLKLAWGVIFTIGFSLIWLIIQLLSGPVKFVKTPLYYPIGLFIAWCLITLFWVENWYFAIMLFAIFISSALIFGLIINTFKSISSINALLITLIVAMTIVSMIGLMQYYFYDNVFIVNIFAQSNSLGTHPAATFGNKNFASHFIVMTLPLSFVFLISAKDKFITALYSLSLFIGSWFLIYTLARQAYVAIFVEIVIIALFFWLDFYKNGRQALLMKIKRKGFKLISLLIVLISLLFASNFTNTGWNSDSEEKINKIQNITLEGGSNRISAWKNTIEMIKDSPIFGVGVGQWQHLYPLYYDRVVPDIIFNEKSKLQRLHNDYLEIFANVGLIGYVFLVWLLILVTNKIWKILTNPDNKNRLPVLGVSMGLVGFSVVALFSFPVRVFLPVFLVFVYFALIQLYTFPHNGKDVVVKFYTINSKVIKLILIVAVTIIALSVTKFTYRWVVAEDHFLNSLAFFNTSKMNDYAINAGQKAILLNDKNSKYYLIVGESLLKKGWADEAIPYLERSVDISKYNTISLLNLADAYRNSTAIEDKINKERGVLEYVLSFDPINVKALSLLVRSLAKNKRGKDANTAYQHLKKSFEYFKGRSNFGPYHFTVGYTAVSIGDYKYAQYVYQDGVDRFPTAENYVELATIEFNFLQNLDKGIVLYKKALELNPNVTKNQSIKALIKQYESNAKQ